VIIIIYHFNKIHMNKVIESLEHQIKTRNNVLLSKDILGIPHETVKEIQDEIKQFEKAINILKNAGDPENNILVN